MTMHSVTQSEPGTAGHGEDLVVVSRRELAALETERDELRSTIRQALSAMSTMNGVELIGIRSILRREYSS